MILQIFILIGMAFFAALVGFWISDRDPPTTIRSVVVDESHAVVPGGTLRVEYTVKRRRSCSVILEQILFDAKKTRYIMPEQKYTIEPGLNGDEEFVLPIPIPEGFTPGPARFRAIRTYACNPIHAWFWPVVLQSSDVDFTVKEGTKP